jgi:hypothetical protein
MTPTDPYPTPALRLIDVAVLNDVERYHNQHGQRLGLGPTQLYAVIRAISSAVTLAEAAWEALDLIPGIAGQESRSIAWQEGQTVFVLQLARAEVFGRQTTVAIDIRLRPVQR